MWYGNDSSLDYRKPIACRYLEKDAVSLLIPQIENGSYKVIGYNWFNMDSGEYKSCCMFDTAQEAVKSRMYVDYEVFNVNIDVNKVK